MASRATFTHFMIERLQVVLSDREMSGIQRLAKRDGLTVGHGFGALWITHSMRSKNEPPCQHGQKTRTLRGELLRCQRFARWFAQNHEQDARQNRG
jgi:hypothetical protein